MSCTRLASEEEGRGRRSFQVEEDDPGRRRESTRGGGPGKASAGLQTAVPLVPKPTNEKRDELGLCKRKFLLHPV